MWLRRRRLCRRNLLRGRGIGRTLRFLGSVIFIIKIRQGRRERVLWTGTWWVRVTHSLEEVRFKVFTLGRLEPSGPACSLVRKFLKVPKFWMVQLKVPPPIWELN